jgi:F-type H+-transporting ATPase subunit b
MNIDWFTVSAQAVNFLVLVWLLKRFLYKPILDAIDAREASIAAELASADATGAEARKERDEFRQKNEAFDDERAGLLATATGEVHAERQRLLDEARAAADAMSAQRRDALNREQQSLNDEITRRTREEVFAVARKTLTDLAGASLEDRMCEVFTHRLRALNGEAMVQFAKGLTASGPALVRSAFELQTGQQDAIRLAINETFAVEADVRFETAPNVICGIELTANGHKVAWSIADYLGSLSQSVGELLHQPPASEASTEKAS